MVDTKQRILNNAIELFSSKSFEETSIIDICEKCSSTKGTFYYHYKSKDDLLLEYYDMLLMDTIKVTNDLIILDSPYEQLWKLMENQMQRAIKLGPDLLKRLIIVDINRECGLFTPYASFRKKRSIEYVDLVLNIIAKGQEKGEIRHTKKQRELYFAFISGMETINMNWSATGGKLEL